MKKNQEDGKITIVVLPAGWVIVGRLFRDEDEGRTEDSFVIRNWGTERGLGQLAAEGPGKKTVLDPSGLLAFIWSSAILKFECNQSVWSQVK